MGSEKEVYLTMSPCPSSLLFLISLVEYKFMWVIQAFLFWEDYVLKGIDCSFYKETQKMHGKIQCLLDTILPRENKNCTSSPVFPEYTICCEYTQGHFKGKFAVESKTIM